MRRWSISFAWAASLLFASLGLNFSTHVGQNGDAPSLLGFGVALAGVNQEPMSPPPVEELPIGTGHIRIQHILIGFRGTVAHKRVTRTREEANQLAHKLYERVNKGEDFGHLVREYSDDRDPGIYTIADRGATLNPGDYPRDAFSQDWADACFDLKVGQVSIIEYDPDKFVGWHIIKRLE